MAHWQRAMEQAAKELRKTKGERRQVLRRRIEATQARIGIITRHMQVLAQAEAGRRKREQQAEEAIYWQSFEQRRRHPKEENAQAAKRAFLFLAKRHHAILVDILFQFAGKRLTNRYVPPPGRAFSSARQSRVSIAVRE